MTGIARKISQSGYYHVTARGTGRQLIFEDDNDRLLLLDKLRDAFAKGDIKVICWCLMENHFHLLVFDEKQGLSVAFQPVLSSYARLYNRKTGHSGHLFDARFWSEPIENEAQLLETVRYIHNNPQNAGISAACDYAWSSYGQYARGEEGLADTNLVLSMLGGAEGVVALSTHAPLAGEAEIQAEDARGLDSLRYDARVAESLMSHGISHAADAKALPKPKRNDLLRDLRGRGLSIRQVERLTGIGRGVIQNLEQRDENVTK